MLLRNHPKLEHQWPPIWGGFYGPGDKLPFGEDPERLVSVEESREKGTITLEAEYEHREFIAVMTIKDSNFRSRLVEVLQENIGNSIKEIGSMDLPF